MSHILSYMSHNLKQQKTKKYHKFVITVFNNLFPILHSKNMNGILQN